MSKNIMRIIPIVILLITSCNSSNESQPPTEEENTATPEVTFADRIMQHVSGVQTVPVATTLEVESGGSQALVEITTDPEDNNEDTAVAVFAIALEELMNTYNVPAPIYFSLVIDDGTVKTAYEHNRETQTFDIRNLE